MEKQYDSVALSKHLEKLTVAGRSHLVFVIGGSLGLSKKVFARADEKLSFSDTDISTSNDACDFT